MLKFLKNKKTKLPKEGSFYTHNQKNSAYNGMKGVVYHHSCKTRFYIITESSVLTNIIPNK